MKVVLLCGHQPNQVALANKIAARFTLAGIAIEQPVAKKFTAFSFSALLDKILNRTVFLPIHRCWIDLLQFYKKQHPAFPAAEKCVVNNINDDAVVNFLQKIKPDLIMVSGTAMLKKKILSVPVAKGIINLHTGLSPYVKGAPNCTNWCLATGNFHLVGNTVMWIDAGIDSGDIITTEQTVLNGTENLLELHVKVMEHAHDLYVRAADKIEKDCTRCPKVKQSSIAAGVTYYSRQWNSAAKWRMLRNFKNYAACFSKSNHHVTENIITVPLQS